MKNKVTLTLQPRVTHRAKALARSRGKSLSSMVEELLEKEIGESPSSQKQSFSQRWAGTFTLKSDKEDPRLDYLKRKYQIQDSSE